MLTLLILIATTAIGAGLGKLLGSVIIGACVGFLIGLIIRFSRGDVGYLDDVGDIFD